jgi:hypothetical protein
MLVTYAELCATLTRDARTGDLNELEIRLTLLKSGDAGVMRFAENLEKHECRLDGAIWVELAEALLGAPAQIDELCAVVKTVLLKHRFCGGTVTPTPRRLGRVTSPANFRGTLAKQHAFADPTAFDTMYDRIQQNADRARAQLGTLYLVHPDYVMWSTFDGSDDTRDPFEDDSSAERLWSRLGLSGEMRDKPLLLFVYSLPSDVEPKYPTVAEACSPPESLWNPKFRPAPPGYPWGETEPVLPGDDGAPEVVHRSITGATLQLRVRELNWT